MYLQTKELIAMLVFFVAGAILAAMANAMNKIEPLIHPEKKRQVYKKPSCGCCKKWGLHIDHYEEQF
ncbi:hypothetical protein KO525_05990 [Psychrosphaera sp. B3R10]|uniref:hypothetical protein n=1 Tax=unclassified Psychrosphaera TaxID=2641570 RepID=UPI001C09FAE6|nr:MULTISPECIES: hypothetical protein [unclassified Psychrosphaera]MBU2882246.1 hypothetical protein [Psychrosphaera sp. I2R16]MBU2988927.1 hypothetical protein [Psychrosphaera sp. B3R10]